MMKDKTSTAKQFSLTPAVIEARRSALQELSFVELSKISENQKGEDPQEVIGRVSRADKKKMIETIIEHMVKNHHLITEERYQFVEWLYRIRAHHGNHYGFLQPDFICIIFGKLMVSKYQRSDTDIKQAVNEWCEDPATAEVKYGQISKWNTSMVTNMKDLFEGKSDFDDDISKWNVSSVTNMEGMFHRTPFNGDISRWVLPVSLT